MPNEARPVKLTEFEARIQANILTTNAEIKEAERMAAKAKKRLEEQQKGLPDLKKAVEEFKKNKADLRKQIDDLKARLEFKAKQILSQMQPGQTQIVDEIVRRYDDATKKWEHSLNAGAIQMQYHGESEQHVLSKVDHRYCAAKRKQEEKHLSYTNLLVATIKAKLSVAEGLRSEIESNDDSPTDQLTAYFLIREMAKALEDVDRKFVDDPDKYESDIVSTFYEWVDAKLEEDDERSIRDQLQETYKQLPALIADRTKKRKDSLLASIAAVGVARLQSAAQ